MLQIQPRTPILRIATMAPMSPISKKRASPSQSDDSLSEEPNLKKRRVETIMPNTPPPELPEEYFTAKAEKIPMFDDDPHQLLLRAVALALEHVGFTGASPEALEAFCAEVDVCMYCKLISVYIY